MTEMKLKISETQKNTNDKGGSCWKSVEVVREN
jgi:hypothetical protein